MEAVDDVALEAVTYLGDDFFRFVIDDGKESFIIDVVGISNVTFLCILWWIK